jgi:hypothetical protein
MMQPFAVSSQTCPCGQDIVAWDSLHRACAVEAIEARASRADRTSLVIVISLIIADLKETTIPDFFLLTPT